MHHSVTECPGLTNESIDFLKLIEQQMSIVADLSRADILLYAKKSSEEVLILAHAQPHSIAHMYNKNRTGRLVSAKRRPEVLRALTSGKRQKEQRSFISEGAPVVRQVLPIYFPPPCIPLPEQLSPNKWPQEQPRVIAALVVATTLIEHERHRLRSEVYRKALKKLQAMLLCGQVIGVENLSPFGEQDGIIFIDSGGVIQYASGVAASIYRRIGYKEALVGRPLIDLETGDEELRQEVLAQKYGLEREAQEADRFWIRKALALIAYPSPYLTWLKNFNIPQQTKDYGVLILLHDTTESRRQDQEIRIKNAMIQEVHHRVKNNLQTIAGLLRMQARRVKSEEARLVLDEALNRIFSVAVIHEFLSNNSSNIINIKKVSNRIINQLQQVMVGSEKAIRLQVTGDPIYLPARQATACSLIINELVQNAIEHGFEYKQEGLIGVDLEDNGDEVIIKVTDNGDGVPDSFQIDQADSLGLYIVKILVEGDLKGQIQLENGLDNSRGLGVKIMFSKTIFRGEEGWKEHVSL